MPDPRPPTQTDAWSQVPRLPCRSVRTTMCAQACRIFAAKYYEISDSRPDLLYRLYSTRATLSAAETVQGKKKNIRLSASNQLEIRFLLNIIFDKAQTSVVNLSLQRSTRDHVLLMVNGLLYYEVHSPADVSAGQGLWVKGTRPGHFFTQTFVLESAMGRPTILSDALQIYSHNLKRKILRDAPRNFKISQVIGTTIRSPVYKTTSTSDEVPKLFVLPNAEACTSPYPVTTMIKDAASAKEQHRLETDTAREAASEYFRTDGWDAFVYGEDVSEDLFDPSARRTASMYSDAHKKAEGEGLFLTCFGDVENTHDVKTAKSRSYDEKETKTEEEQSTAYLRLFGFRPIPDGPPVEWDLSQDAVLTQLKNYQEVVDRLQIPVSAKGNARPVYPRVEWYQRTVFLDNLPRDVHPESLRRAFETTFGEIEAENGILLATGPRSSVAYIVFKSLESAIAVGRADSWVNGSKILIQKYLMP